MPPKLVRLIKAYYASAKGKFRANEVVYCLSRFAQAFNNYVHSLLAC